MREGRGYLHVFITLCAYVYSRVMHLVMCVCICMYVCACICHAVAKKLPVLGLKFTT